VLEFISEFLVSCPVSKNIEIKLYALNMSLLFVCGLPKYTLKTQTEFFKHSDD
jgi:hypothetical protein